MSCYKDWASYLWPSLEKLTIFFESQQQQQHSMRTCFIHRRKCTRRNQTGKEDIIVRNLFGLKSLLKSEHQTRIRMLNVAIRLPGRIGMLLKWQHRQIKWIKMKWERGGKDEASKLTEMGEKKQSLDIESFTKWKIHRTK